MLQDEFKRQATAFVEELPWVREVEIVMDAQRAKAMLPDTGRPQGLKNVNHVIAVSSCKGGQALNLLPWVALRGRDATKSAAWVGGSVFKKSVFNLIMHGLWMPLKQP